ncbi:MAG: hypothetical protein QXX08_00710 [Candidatus Bathyarchaeia archaeon]
MKKIYYAGLVVSAVLLVAVATPQIFGLLSDSLNLSSTGSVKTVNISAYDSDGVTPLTSFSWGLIEAGGSATKTIYLKNEGTATVRVSMQINSASWNPSTAKNYITITWNREGQTIAASQSLQATLTCSVSSSIPSSITSFSVEIIITGTEAT